MAKRDNRDEPGDEVVESALAVLSKELPDTAEQDVDEDTLEGDLVDGAEEAVPDDLTFTTEVAEPDTEPAEGDVLEIKLDGDILVARKPAKGAWSLILGSVSSAATEADRTQAMLSFVYASFDPVSRMILQQRMLDPDDPFGAGLLSKMVTKLITKWAPNQSRAERRAAMRMTGRRNGHTGPVART